MNFRAVIVSLAVLFSFASLAQTTPPPSAAPAASASRTYVPADFAQFAPRTALDMLGRVPGFSIRSESQERGLGQATGNVLINGQRVSGKSNDVVTELSRIPATNVERIEIVDGATLGIPGLSGQVANVVVRSRGISGQYAWRPEFRSYFTDPLFSRFEVSVSGRRGPVEYTLGLDNGASRSGAGGPTWIYGADRSSLVEERDDEWRGNGEYPRVSGRFVYDGPGTAVGNLNLSYARPTYDYLEVGKRTGPGLVDRERRVTSEENGGNAYEAGADYEMPLAIGRLKFIGVARGSHSPSDTAVTTSYADGTPATGNRVQVVGDSNERIARGEYRWNARGGEFQITAEGAFNSLDSATQLFVLRPSGNYEEIPLPGATARVEEDRYEVMGSYGRSLSPTLAMKVSAGGEYSQLAQIGGDGKTRTFQRPKGELSVAWKASPRMDVNVKLGRRVGQLDFGDFLASVNLRDDVENAANPDLVPQQSWELDVEAVRNLGAVGTTTLHLYGRQIDDIIDYIPIGATGESPGNLDEATIYGIESISTFNLDRFGWNGARLDAHLLWQDSAVEDPLTGEQRPISSSLQEMFDISLRHDLANSNWAWGSGYSYQLNAKDYRLSEVGRQWEGPVWGSVYIEHKNVRGLTVRATVGNLLAADSMWDRTVHTGRRTGPIAYVEHRDRTIGPIFSFSFRGKF